MSPKDSLKVRSQFAVGLLNWASGRSMTSSSLLWLLLGIVLTGNLENRSWLTGQSYQAQTIKNSALYIIFE